MKITQRRIITVTSAFNEISTENISAGKYCCDEGGGITPLADGFWTEI
jgi:hypothetical protein